MFEPLEEMPSVLNLDPGERTKDGMSHSPRASNSPEPSVEASVISSNRDSCRSEEPGIDHSSTTPLSESKSEEPTIKHMLPPSLRESSKSPEPPSQDPLIPSIEEAHHVDASEALGKDTVQTAQAPSLLLKKTTTTAQAKTSEASLSPSEAVQENDQQIEIGRNSRSLRKRKREAPSVDHLMRPLTEDERRNWPGWAEIESEPALFNHILKRHGVKDVKIKELMMGVDDEFLATLPQPVYGLIFLFKYRDSDDETVDGPKCPANIWFANQIASNSCATVAMLNILMNVPEIDLGDTLHTFKAATILKKPPYRGLELKNNAAIRVVHNSFVRRVEMLNADLYLQNEFEKWQKSQKANKKRKVAASNKKTARQKKQEEEEPAFHFIAYVPINGEVWRMDGMQRHPINLGSFDGTGSGNWMSVARENIYAQMARYPNDESYNFMALCKSPLTIIKADLASNARSLHDVEAKLSSTNPDWRSLLPHTSSPSLPANGAEEQEQQHGHSNSDHEPSPPRELSDSYGLTSAVILAASPTPVIADRLERAGTDIEALMMLRAKLVTEEKRLMRLHCEEVMEDSDQDEKAKMHMIDYGPDMYKLVRKLLDSGRLREMWDDL